MLNTVLAKLFKDLVSLIALIIYYLLVLAFIFYNSLVMTLFDYADLVWGDKHNVTLMSSLQVLQNKAAKIICDKPLFEKLCFFVIAKQSG